MSTAWGPLEALAGEWAGEEGLDISYSHVRDEMVPTPYRERATLQPFGPVRNGDQQLFGLDYRSAMCRAGETEPFHIEAGYWLWDAATSEVLRAVVVPRGITVLAGGTAAHDASGFAVAADLGAPDHTIVQNQYLAERASSLSYRATITVHADGSWTYDAITMLSISERPEPVAHTDRNTLDRVA